MSAEIIYDCSRIAGIHHYPQFLLSHLFPCKLLINHTSQRSFE